MTQRLAKSGFLRGLLEEEANDTDHAQNKKLRRRQRKPDAAHKLQGTADMSNATEVELALQGVHNASTAEPHTPNRSLPAFWSLPVCLENNAQKTICEQAQLLFHLHACILEASGQKFGE